MIRQLVAIQQEFYMTKIALICKITLFALMISPGYALPLDETGWKRSISVLMKHTRIRNRASFILKAIS